MDKITSFSTQNLTPCGQALKLKYAIKALHAAQAAGNTLEAADAFASGDIIGGLDKLAAAKGSVGQMMKSCFVAGTPIRLADGTSKPIEQIRGYDEHGDNCDIVLCRDEYDPTAPLTAKRVLQTFIRVSPVLNVHVRGRVIGTTAEHPFYVQGKGWRCAFELEFGDKLLTSAGEWIACEGVADSGAVTTVYNFEVEEAHTYFVGEEGWGFDVWAHNYNIDVNTAAGRLREARRIKQLQKQYPGASIQRERYLRGANGKRLKDTAVTGEARRVDLAVVKDGKLLKLEEVTSKTASKAEQAAKEARIRATGDVFIRDKTTGNLINVSGIPTDLIRM